MSKGACEVQMCVMKRVCSTQSHVPESTKASQDIGARIIVSWHGAGFNVYSFGAIDSSQLGVSGLGG